MINVGNGFWEVLACQGFGSSLQSLTQRLGWGPRTPLPLQLLPDLRVLIPGVWEPRPGIDLGPYSVQTGLQEGRGLHPSARNSSSSRQMLKQGGQCPVSSPGPWAMRQGP